MSSSAANPGMATTAARAHASGGMVAQPLSSEGIDGIGSTHTSKADGASTYNPLSSYGKATYDIDNSQPGSNNDLTEAQSVQVDSESAYSGAPTTADTADIDVSLQSVFGSLLEMRDTLRTSRDSKDKLPKKQLEQYKSALTNINKNTLDSLTQAGGTSRTPAGALQLVTVAKQVEYLLTNDYNTPLDSQAGANPYQQKPGTETDDQLHARVAAGDVGEANMNLEQQQESVYGINKK